MTEHRKRAGWIAGAPVGAAMVAFAAMAALSIDAPDTADRVLRAWGVQPFSFRFLDIDTVLSALRCRRAGIDVLLANPCDALGRVFDYSPLWLHADIFPVTTAWIVPAGLLVDLLFLASLLLLPRPKSGPAAVVMTAAILSTPVAFAMERANNDLIVFALAAAAARLLLTRRWPRALGYACAFLAGLLKYYPMLLLALLCRERPRAFLAGTALAGLALAAIVALEFETLRQVLRLIPTGSHFGDMFGAETLPFGLAELCDASPATARTLLIALLATAATAALRRALSPQTQRDLAQIGEAERLFLVTGALLILGCFLSAQNIGYRALHLLLTIPGLLALARTNPTHRRAIATALLLLWAEAWRTWLPPQTALPAWLLRECCWWTLTTHLTALTLTTLKQSSLPPPKTLSHWRAWGAERTKAG